MKLKTDRMNQREKFFGLKLPGLYPNERARMESAVKSDQNCQKFGEFSPENLKGLNNAKVLHSGGMTLSCLSLMVSLVKGHWPGFSGHSQLTPKLIFIEKHELHYVTNRTLLKSKYDVRSVETC